MQRQGFIRLLAWYRGLRFGENFASYQIVSSFSSCLNYLKVARNIFLSHLECLSPSRAWVKESISVPHRNRTCNLPNIAWMLLYQVSYKQTLVDLLWFTFDIVLLDSRWKDGACDLPYRWNLVFYSNQATISNLKR